MGDSKRRKETLGQEYGKESRIVPWLPITKTQANQFNQLTTIGAWVGIAALLLFWVTVRWLGPTLGWWQLSGLQ